MGRPNKRYITGDAKNIYNQIDSVPKMFQTFIEKWEILSRDSINKRPQLGKDERKNRTTESVEKGQNKTTLKLNIPWLNKNERQRKYRHDLDTKLLHLAEATPNTTWCATDELKCVQTIIRQAGEVSVGLCKNNKYTKYYHNLLSILTKKQKI